MTDIPPAAPRTMEEVYAEMQQGFRAVEGAFGAQDDFNGAAHRTFADLTNASRAQGAQLAQHAGRLGGHDTELDQLEEFRRLQMELDDGFVARHNATDERVSALERLLNQGIGPSVGLFIVGFVLSAWLVHSAGRSIANFVAKMVNKETTMSPWSIWIVIGAGIFGGLCFTALRSYRVRNRPQREVVYTPPTGRSSAPPANQPQNPPAATATQNRTPAGAGHR